MTTLLGCKPIYNYHYFMLHPDDTVKVYQQCNETPSKFKDNSICFAAERAAADIKAQIVILNLDRLRFGMQVMRAETQLAEAKQSLKQLQPQQIVSDRVQRQTAVLRSQEKVAQLLAILLFSSEKSE